MMGVLLLDGITSPVMQSRVNLNARDVIVDVGVIGVVDETNNNVSGLTDANSLPTPTRVVDIIDIINGGEPPRQDEWMPPPPKKKWIRHYLLGETTRFVYSRTLCSDILSESVRIFIESREIDWQN